MIEIKNRVKNPLLNIEPRNPQESEYINHLALNELFKNLKERGYVNDISIEDGINHPGNLTDARELILRKILAIKDALR